MHPDVTQAMDETTKNMGTIEAQLKYEIVRFWRARHDNGPVDTDGQYSPREAEKALVWAQGLDRATPAGVRFRRLRRVQDARRAIGAHLAESGAKL